MELEAGDGSLKLEWDIRNDTDKPAAPFFKVHPEFWTRNFKAPELWLAKNGEWHEHPLKAANREGFFGGEEMDPKTMDQWAARIARKRYLVMDVDAQGLENTFYFFNTRNEHLNLELIPDQSPLQPGETRHIETRLDIVKRLTN